MSDTEKQVEVCREIVEMKMSWAPRYEPSDNRHIDALISAVRADEKARCIAAVNDERIRVAYAVDGMALHHDGAYVRVSTAVEAIRNA